MKISNGGQIKGQEKSVLEVRLRGEDSFQICKSPPTKDPTRTLYFYVPGKRSFKSISMVVRDKRGKKSWRGRRSISSEVGKT